MHMAAFFIAIDFLMKLRNNTKSRTLFSENYMTILDLRVTGISKDYSNRYMLVNEGNGLNLKVLYILCFIYYVTYKNFK